MLKGVNMITEPSQEEVRRRLCKSRDLLLQNDLCLLQKDVNERSISHRFAIYLDQLFGDWGVDCEYNRNHSNTKQLDIVRKILIRTKTKLEPDDTTSKSVFPDVIVHHRGKDENLLVIEMKKTTNRLSDDFDFEKLKGFRQQFGYKYAAFLRLKTGCEYPCVAKLEWV